MRKFNHILLLCSLFFAQACSSFRSMHQATGNPSALDGAWISVKCTCAGKDVKPADTHSVDVLFINGNLVLVNQMTRWKKPEPIGYCSVHQEAVANKVSDDRFEITTVSERTFSPNEIHCGKIEEFEHKPKRTWKVLSVNNSELKIESTSGCRNEPMICSHKRLEQ